MRVRCLQDRFTIVQHVLQPFDQLQLWLLSAGKYMP